MRLRISIVMAVVLLSASACAAGDIDLDLVLDELGTTDLSESDDPGVQAAGETVVEILSVREAEENLARGIAERDPAAIEQARRLRPEDPRYPMHALALSETGEGGTGQQKILAISTIGLIWGQNPDMERSEVLLVSHEMYGNALRDIIKSAPEFEGRAGKVKAYCHFITKTYPEDNTEAFPQRVAFYLALEADRSLCPGG
jgi:hypothetical protein